MFGSLNAGEFSPSSSAPRFILFESYDSTNSFKWMKHFFPGIQHVNHVISWVEFKKKKRGGNYPSYDYILQNGKGQFPKYHETPFYSTSSL